MSGKETLLTVVKDSMGVIQEAAGILRELSQPEHEELDVAIDRLWDAIEAAEGRVTARAVRP